MNKTNITLIALLYAIAAINIPAQDRPLRQRPPSERPDGRGGPPGERAQRPPAQRYSIEQAVSDRGQLHTIAFSGLAFITGDFGASTFMPPGKVCDFFGFRYMRDIDAAQKGHNPMFLNRVAGNVLETLNDAQKQKFLDLADEQASQLEELARMRLPLIKAFHRQLDAQIPTGSDGLNEAAVVRYVGDIFARDAELSLRRAEVMAQVWRSLTPEQNAYFAKMKFGDFNSWPAIDERDKIKNVGRGKSQLFNVAYMTYASEFFSWTAGNLEADTYFCPERHGTYFGGFYMKDMPAMGKRDYDISTSRTGDGGRDFLEQVLNESQRAEITGILAKQKKAIIETITVRRAIATELRKLLSGGTPDKQKILSLGRHYGELDGEMSWLYATAFAKVNRTLTDSQRAALMKLRNLDSYKSAEAYIYSRSLAGKLDLPDTDHFFFLPKPLDNKGAKS
ncbi:MAG: Spy/CpxP family protein refolding chaperone [Verrucomicrobia bacterium]|jgi:Spy/CpxP family protein refolding chaperone|nr:Spy/CpxP family protein refolding chaperone [Verrucomicrobiota bacterium]